MPVVTKEIVHFWGLDPQLWKTVIVSLIIVQAFIVCLLPPSPLGYGSYGQTSR